MSNTNAGGLDKAYTASEAMMLESGKVCGARIRASFGRSTIGESIAHLSQCKKVGMMVANVPEEDLERVLDAASKYMQLSQVFWDFKHNHHAH